MTTQEIQALRELKQNDTIMIVPADKGNAAVVVNTDEYKRKIFEHLSDEETYCKQDNDNSDTLRKTVNEFLKELLNKRLITNDEYKKLFANSAIIPLFYALIKIHKPGYPIRPIVSFVNSPSYNIA